MLSPTTIPAPLLLLLALVCSPSTSITIAPVNASPAPAAQPLPNPALEPRSVPSTLPLYRRSSNLRKRSSPDATRSWALAEMARVKNKYSVPGEEAAAAGLRRRRPQDDTGVVNRLETAISVAGYGTTTTTAGATSSAATASSTTSAGTNATKTGNSTSPLPTAPVGQVKVWNYDADLAYYAAVGVGSPPQYLNVILDTGSADLWITGGACTNLTGCVTTPLLNETASNSSIDMQTSFSVRYGYGSASGDLYKDYVGFAGYNVSNQTFAAVQTISNDLLGGNISGLFGLGWQPLAASGATPFWQNLYNAGVLPFPGFAVQLTRFVNATSASTVEPGGLLTFGYLNTSLYRGDIHYTSIPNGLESYWIIPMAGVGVNGVNMTLPTDAMVAIDTGTTLIGGPQDVVSQVYAGIPGALAATGAYSGYYSYPCATKVNISLTFGNMTWNISADDFNLGPFGTTNNVSTCLGAFFDVSLGSTSKISWVIGAAFLKNVFSVFRANPPSVGFAMLSNGSAPTYTYNSSSNGTRDGNLTQIPAGIYGPVGQTSSSTSPPTPTTTPSDEGITTAIEAGQTVSRTPNVAAAANLRPIWMSKEGMWGSLGVVVATLAGWSLLL